MKNLKISGLTLMSDEEMRETKGGFSPLGILDIISLSNAARNNQTFYSGSMSEDEYGDWVVGLTGGAYDW